MLLLYYRIMKTRNITQNQLVGYWAKTKGITLKDLERHKQINDVVLLLQFKDHFNVYFTKSETASWGAIWGIVYHKKRSLKQKHLHTLANIGKRIKHRQEKIKQLRQQNRDHSVNKTQGVI